MRVAGDAHRLTDLLDVVLVGVDVAIGGRGGSLLAPRRADAVGFAGASS
ncbi:hypothetical protein [Pseudofrankia sp. EUN1h]|nr:hypothetical protein [Pseudofrankia sp. EUN1h]